MRIILPETFSWDLLFNLRSQQSLPDTELRVASEYYTEEELKAKFKKRKKVKARARTALTADDLVPDEELQPSMSTTDLGNRAARDSRDGADAHSTTVDPLSAITDPRQRQSDLSQSKLPTLQ